MSDRPLSRPKSMLSQFSQALAMTGAAMAGTPLVLECECPTEPAVRTFCRLERVSGSGVDGGSGRPATSRSAQPHPAPTAWGSSPSAVCGRSAA